MQTIAPPGFCRYWSQLDGGSSPRPSTLLFAAASTPASVAGPASPEPTWTPMFALAPAAGLVVADWLAGADAPADPVAFALVPSPESVTRAVPSPVIWDTVSPMPDPSTITRAVERTSHRDRRPGPRRRAPGQLGSSTLVDAPTSPGTSSVAAWYPTAGSWEISGRSRMCHFPSTLPHPLNVLMDGRSRRGHVG